MKRLNLLALLLIVGSLGLASCNKEDSEPNQPLGPNATVNQWILEVMQEVYLWLESMGTPIAEDSDPEDYFESLLARPTDRFSIIVPDYDELINSLNGITMEAGYEFNLFRQSQDNENVVAEITYIKKNSPAASRGLRRGDIIHSINNTVITLSNYRELLGAISENHSLSFLRFNETTLTYQDQGTLELTTMQLAEDPNFLDTVYTINNEKIGYVVYHFFAPGPGQNSKAYDQEMDAIFGKFKSEGINHLILDFRYNGGGYVSSAINLASLIAPGVTENDIFSKTKYNSFLSQFDDFQNVNRRFLSKAENLGTSLSGNRLYILTSTRTASASELIINGLRPYMDVFLIGEVTTGKNVGSIPIQDEDNPSNSYGLLPIVTQSFNSNDESDYSNGFNPNITVDEATERLRPFGDVTEQLLRTALTEITGEAPSGRFQKLDRVTIGSSLDQKIRSGRMIEKMN